MKTHRTLAITSLLFLTLPLFAQPNPGGTQLDDWGAFAAVDAQLKNAAPQVVIDGFRRLYESRPNMLALVGIKVSINIADAYKKLGNGDKVVEIDDWCIKKYAAANEVVWPVSHEADALLAARKYDDLGKLVTDNWVALVRGAQSDQGWLAMYASSTVRAVCDGYAVSGQEEKSIDLILKSFSAMPALWDDKSQGMGDWKNGWMYDVLVRQLIKAKRNDEALRWAKFHYVTGSFDKDSIARATTSLGRVWGEAEEFQKIRVFGLLQEPGADAALKNPLAEVKLPEFDAEFLKAQLARTAPGKDGTQSKSKAKEAIALLLAQGDYAGAMTIARRIMKDDPTKPDGTLQICKVFKAADCSVRRANQFLEYLEGKAENPVPGFLKEFEKKAS